MPYYFMSEDSFKRAKYAHVSMQLIFEIISERCEIEMKYRAMLHTFYDKYTHKIRASLVMECSGVRIVFSEFLLESLRTANISRMVTDGIRGDEGPLMSIKLWIRNNEKQNAGMEAKEEYQTAMVPFNIRLAKIEKHQLRYYNTRTTLEILDKRRERLAIKRLDKPHKGEQYERKLKEVEKRRRLKKNEEETHLDKYLTSLHHDVDHRASFESSMEEINEKFNRFERERIETMLNSVKIYISQMKLLDVHRQERAEQLDKIENIIEASDVTQELNDWNKSYLERKEYPVFKEYDASATVWHIDSDVSFDTDSDDEEPGAKGGISNLPSQEHYMNTPTTSSFDQMDLLFTPVNLRERVRTSTLPEPSKETPVSFESDKTIPTALAGSEQALFTPVNLHEIDTASSEPTIKTVTGATDPDQLELFNTENLRVTASLPSEPAKRTRTAAKYPDQMAFSTPVNILQTASTSQEPHKRSRTVAKSPEEAAIHSEVQLHETVPKLTDKGIQPTAPIPKQEVSPSDPGQKIPSTSSGKRTSTSGARQRKRPLPPLPVKRSLPKLTVAIPDSDSSDEESKPQPKVPSKTSMQTSQSESSTDSLSDISLGKETFAQSNGIKLPPASKEQRTSSSEEEHDQDERTKIANMTNVKVVAILSHTAEKDGEISFQLGQTIKQKRRADENGMAYGYMKKGKFNRKIYGYYPVAAVVLKVKSKTVKKTSFLKKWKKNSEKYIDSGAAARQEAEDQGQGSWVESRNMADNALEKPKSKINLFRKLFKKK